jgi:class 3 adenylate cyclase
MVTTEQLMAAVGESFGGDEVVVGVVVSGTVRFVGGSAPSDKSVWRAIAEVLESGSAQEVLSAEGGTYVVPLYSSDGVSGVLLVRRSDGTFAAADHTAAALVAGRLSATLAGQRAFDRLDSLLRHFMPFDVATTLVHDPDQGSLGGSLRDVTVLFADLRGYTTYAERYPPDEVVAMLNRYFEIVVPVLVNHGGTITSFIGDALMVIFNAPVAQPEHALLAARAGLAVQAAIEQEAGHRPGWPRFRVGMHTGPALVGNIGSQQRRTYSAIGDTTNVASRLEGIAEEGSVVVSGQCLRAITGAAPRTRPLGSIAVKGRQEPVEAHVLEGFAEQVPGGHHTSSLTRSELDRLTTEKP